MPRPRTAYEVSESQVTTPLPAISLFWRLAKRHRRRLGTVLDMGAGDCRFARGGFFDRYVGLEIDKARAASAQPLPAGTIIHACAFQHRGRDYDACIGNPPYARHHDIGSRWKKRTIARLQRELGVSLDKHCNLYIYFFCLGLLKAKRDGLVAMVVPYEWVSRPSAKGLRDCIERHGWSVAVYRFQTPVFQGVLTTASVSIIDKARHDGSWKFYDITPDCRVIMRSGITGSGKSVLNYARRGKIWALRGLSPGSQKVFTLTEAERIRAGLSKRDVVPCVTTLREVPRELRMLSSAAFRKHFVSAGAKCWLIRSCDPRRSKALDVYLDAVPKKDRQTYTCRSQKPWFNYKPHPVPEVLFSSGFTKFGPKVLVNSVGARAVGSAWGIHSKRRLPLRSLQAHLLELDFEKRVVAHAKTLKKVEVGQLNAVLNRFEARERRNGRKHPR
jgi:Eco57I restriction-modification methylase